ncbi:MAG: hypothetical protein KBA30_01480 [Clostridia bacterium]|nr:hypothetical protein [Clostridia bacterium]
MRQFFSSLFRFYTHKAGGWIGAALLCAAVLPFAIRSFAMLTAGHAIAPSTVVLAEAVGWIAAWLCFVPAVRSLGGHPGGSAVRETVQVFLRGGSGLLAAAAATGVLYPLLAAFGSRLAVGGSGRLYLLLMGVAALLAGGILAALGFWLLCVQAAPRHDTPFRLSFRYWIRKPGLAVPASVAAAAALFLLPMLHNRVVESWPGLSVSFLSRISAAVLAVSAQWTLLLPLVGFLFQHALRQRGPLPDGAAAADGIPVPAARVPFLRRHLAPAAAMAVLLLSLTAGLLTQTVSPVKAVRRDIENILLYQDLAAADGDPATAAYYNNLAAARLLAWRGAAQSDRSLLDRAVALAPSDDQIRLLAALVGGNPLGELEAGFLGRSRPPEWEVALLSAYDRLENPDETQRLRHAELLRSCILHGYHVQTAVLPERLASRPDPLVKELDRLEERLTDGRHYALVARLGAEGGVNPAIVEEALALAEAYPDRIGFQYLAMSCGASYLIDGASHYVRTGEAAIRYHDLYMEQAGKDTPEEEILRTKQAVARALVSCGELRKCADLLSDNPYRDATLDTLRASCLFSLKQYDECLETSAALLEKDPDNPQTLYLAAICSLQTGQRTDSLRYAIRLAELTETAENPLETESLLYPYLLRCTISDSQGGYTTAFFGSMTEEETALLQGNPFLNDYLTAAHLWSRNENDSRTQAVELLDGILKKHPDLSRALYMKGALLHELQKDDEAEETLKASLALDDEQPTAWYALATLYDRIQQYDAAYAACQKVLQYLPASDHAYDVFGVSIHARNLMGKLEPLVKGGN